MSGLRARTAIAVILAVGICTPTPLLAQESRKPDFSGLVRDSVGNVLEGVEILLVAGESGPRPAAITLSDARGKFAVGRLLPGLYRLAAIKEGYRTHVAEIDTGSARWVQLILAPVAALESEGVEVPEDPSWVLRVPRRSVFRETEPDEVGSPDPAGAAEPDALPDNPVNLQVEQVFSTAMPAGGGGQTGDLTGNETRVRLASPVGERGNLRVAGAHESLGSGWSGPDEMTRSASHEAASLSIDFSYDTSLDARLAVRAFYDESDVEFDLPLVQGSQLQEHQRKRWGYQSEWSRQLDPYSSVAVQMEYNQSALELPAATHHLLFDAGPVADRVDSSSVQSLTSQAIRAGGAYESLAAPGHQFEVGFQADMIESPVDGSAFAAGDLSPEVGGNAGFSVRVSAHDTWSVSRQLAVTYGLGYKHSLAFRDAALVVPRLGARLNLGRIVFGGEVSYHALTAWDASSAYLPAGLVRARPAHVSRPEQLVGYEADVEFVLAEGVRLRGSAAYSPVQFDNRSYERGVGFSRPVYLTDGNASVEHSSVALIQDRGDTRTFIEVSQGRAIGLLAPVDPFDLPLRLLAQGELIYHDGRWGLNFVPSGTDLQIEYRILFETGVDSRAAAEQRMIELRLVQDLLRLDTFGSWRLLMAVRVASVDAPRVADSSEAPRQLIDAYNRGVSAGLSVSF